MYEIQLRDVPEQLVVTEQRNVTQAELFDYLVDAMARVHRAAEAHGGGLQTPSFPYLGREDRTPEPVFVVVYSGNPNEGPVPVEVCAPISSEQEGASDVALRRMPAHREAYVRLTKAQTTPDQIGGVYVAVEQWVGAHGLDISDAPREVYFTDWMSAAPDDDVFDVAFPVR
jgi:effector-binding domain-containing protein